jgi:biotin operon repressor
MDIKELKKDVFDVLEDDQEDAQSANKISQELGYAKTNKGVQEALEALYDDGVIDYSDDKGYNIYWKVGELEEGGDTGQGEGSDESAELVLKSPEYTIPKNNFGYGFDVTVRGFKVTDPDGKEIELEGNERLLVINNDPAYRFVVSEPADVISAIGTFTSEKNIGTYLVTNMESGHTISGVDEIDDRVAGIFLTITKHNKAGF